MTVNLKSLFCSYITGDIVEFWRFWSSGVFATLEVSVIQNPVKYDHSFQTEFQRKKVNLSNVSRNNTNMPLLSFGNGISLKKR